MKKNLSKMLATTAIAGLTLFGSPENAKATTLDFVTTAISGGSYGGLEDQDPNRAGIQVRYDWTVRNQDGQDATQDTVWEYAIQANLQERGMYGFINSGSDWSTHSDNVNTSFYWLADLSGNVPIQPSYTKTFSAFIDKDKILGNEQIGSYGLSNNGKTNTKKVTAPITRDMTTTDGINFGWLYDNKLVVNTGSTESYNASANLDSDGDGFSNGEEYITGTNPTNSNS
jgi:hypothetical protein